MKTDSQLQHDVMDELEWDPSVDSAEIGVSVSEGVVTLSGTVKSFAEKIAAEKAARRVAGVKALAENIKVRLAFARKTSDAEIAQRIVSMLAWDVSVPDDAIDVKVESGWVTLSGTVDWKYQSEAAKKDASKIGGVLGVTNLVEVRQMPTSKDVRNRIIAAFRRQADFDSSSVSVFTDGSKVTLSGHVNAWYERQMAERAAWSAPGVTKVEDQIRVY